MSRTRPGVPCPDCRVLPGQPHRTGCDVTRCRLCGRQRLTCACTEQDPEGAFWRGEWPGAAQCRRLVAGQGWQSCAEDAPGATEDLNRWAIFQANGFDGLYETGDG